MKKIKLSGREVSVMREIDFTVGSSGADVLERTQIHLGDLVEIINSLLELGYLETTPPSDWVNPDTFKETLIEVNPSFVHELREAIIPR